MINKTTYVKVTGPGIKKKKNINSSHLKGILLSINVNLCNQVEETTGNRLCTCRCCWCGSQRPRKTKSIKKWLKKENNSCAMWTMVWLLGQSVALAIEFSSGTVKNPIGMSLASSAWTRKPLNVVVLDINWTTKQKNTLQLTDGLNFYELK